MGESEWLAYHDPRVKSYAQYPLSDDSVAGRGLVRFHGFQSGIDTSSGKPKTGVYQAYKTPLFVRLVSRTRSRCSAACAQRRPAPRPRSSRRSAAPSRR